MREILEKIKSAASQASFHIIRRSEGVVLAVGDGIATITGLYGAGLYELLEFPGGARGLAFDLEPNRINVILLDGEAGIRTGDPVWLTDRTLSVPVGAALIGRVVNPLGKAIDGLAPPAFSTFYPLERVAPGVVKRDYVCQPVYTGIRAIDSMVPIGRGQRELIVGDSASGKTSIAVDTIINQKDDDLICIYVAIGQKVSTTLRAIEQLRKYGAMEHTVVVCAGADSPLGQQYIAPYAGCAIAEYFFDKGRDALVVYDDLTRHAEAYRSLSLLLRRPPGREAFPGDIFFLHSRLLERSAKLSSRYGGASITAMPIVETQSGRISSYIPTNLISITDGQIYLDPELFDKSILPAIDIRRSVSRVGGNAQVKAMRDVAKKLKIEYEYFLEVEVFTKFGARLDEETVSVLRRGERLREILKQERFAPMPGEEQICVFYAHGQGYLDSLELPEIWPFLNRFLDELRLQNQEVLSDIGSGKSLSRKTRAKLDKVLKRLATKKGDGPDDIKQGVGEKKEEL
ncbi:MAG: F0F1 ATP synthase subunit alpha [Nitrospirota bacterium]